MNYSRTVSNGSARDDALKRRNNAARKVLGVDPNPKRETEQPAEQKPNEKPSE